MLQEPPGSVAGRQPRIIELLRFSLKKTHSWATARARFSKGTTTCPCSGFQDYDGLTYPCLSLLCPFWVNRLLNVLFQSVTREAQGVLEPKYVTVVACATTAYSATTNLWQGDSPVSLNCFASSRKNLTVGRQPEPVSSRGQLLAPAPGNLESNKC